MYRFNTLFMVWGKTLDMCFHDSVNAGLTVCRVSLCCCEWTCYTPDCECIHDDVSTLLWMEHAQMLASSSSSFHRQLHASKQSADPLDQLFHGPSALFQPRYGCTCSLESIDSIWLLLGRSVLLEHCVSLLCCIITNIRPFVINTPVADYD